MNQLLVSTELGLLSEYGKTSLFRAQNVPQACTDQIRKISSRHGGLFTFSRVPVIGRPVGRRLDIQSRNHIMVTTSFLPGQLVSLLVRHHVDGHMELGKTEQLGQRCLEPNGQSSIRVQQSDGVAQPTRFMPQIKS